MSESFPRRISLIKPSSSVEENDLEEYIQWHISQKEQKRDVFQQTHFELNKRVYDLQIIQSWKSKKDDH